MNTSVHLIYIHGFQGNDTTFQSFPTDLQQRLAAQIPAHLSVKTSLYPTYKSIKPIEFATHNFLEWLYTQSPGPVILLAHSMGGLLAADAACELRVHHSNGRSHPQRVIGVMAFDTPYLGMHPHVVVSGIASLFPKREGKEVDHEGDSTMTEQDLNDETQVLVVDQGVTDDWEEFKRRPAHRHFDSSHSRTSLAPSPVPSPSHTPSPSPSPSPTPSRTPSPFFDKAISFLSTASNDPIVFWMRTHSDAPFSAGKQWVVEHFQFGICMFDPKGLADRYARLVKWEGKWVNYWTETMPSKTKALAESDLTEKSGKTHKDEGGKQTPENVNDVAESLDTDSKQNSGEVPKVESVNQMETKKHAGNKEKQHSPRHFVVLPSGLGGALGGAGNWEKVYIGGAEDEVAAHTGLFIRGMNLDYEGLVDRVGRTVLKWCEGL